MTAEHGRNGASADPATPDAAAGAAPTPGTSSTPAAASPPGTSSTPAAASTPGANEASSTADHEHPAHTTPPPRAIPGTGEAHRHLLVVLVMDRPGVLNRVASLMRARNFNIDSLAVSRTDKPSISRMTLTLHGDDVAIEQATKQLYRLVDVLKVQDVTSDQVVEHELAFVKVRTTAANRSEVIKIVELYKGRVVDIAPESVIVEATGTEGEIDALVALLRSYGIKELVRTGAVVMLRGAGSIEEALKR
jgi:acetolactate synthase-1/3 small subunit